jgi:hypothetical protein
LLLINTMSVFNAAAAHAVISPELARIAAEAWGTVQESVANAPAAFGQMVDALSALSRAEMAAIAGAAGAVSAFLLSNFANRRVPDSLHLVLRSVATRGILPGIALTYPVTSSCFVGSWACVGLLALHKGFLPWTLGVYVHAGVLAMQLRGWHPLIVLDVVHLELGALQHFLALCPVPTSLAVFVSGWMSAKVAGYVTPVLSAAAHLAFKAARFVVTGIAALLVAGFWSTPTAAVRLLFWFVRWAAAAPQRQEDFLFDEEEEEEEEAEHVEVAGAPVVVAPEPAVNLEEVVPDAVASGPAVKLEVEVARNVVASEPAGALEEVADVPSFLGRAKESLAALGTKAVTVASSLRGFFRNLETGVVPFHVLVGAGVAALVVEARAAARRVGALAADQEPLAEFDFLLDDAVAAPAGPFVAARGPAVAARGLGRAPRGGVARRRAAAVVAVVDVTAPSAGSGRSMVPRRAHNLPHPLNPVPTRRSARMTA